MSVFGTGVAAFKPGLYSGINYSGTGGVVLAVGAPNANPLLENYLGDASQSIIIATTALILMIILGIMSLVLLTKQLIVLCYM